MKLRPFELALVIIFVVLMVGALALLSNPPERSSSPDDQPVVSGPVVIWGTMPGDGMETILREYQDLYDSYTNVSYRHIDPDQFESRLTEALADGRGPDLVLLSHEDLVETRRRLRPYSYEQFPPRDIRDRYIEGAQIFALSDGLYALPIAVDPIVMYWNRDILTTEGFLTPPRTWEELVTTQFPDLIQRDFDRTIQRSVLALGEYGNVRNAFGVLSLLLIQGGTQGVTESAGRYEIRLNQAITGNNNPLRTVAEFYTRFSKPSNTLYSWNRSFREDRASFIAEDLVFYFGYASEAPDIERLNPNLNFDIVEVPQGSLATVRRTYGQFYGLALLRTSSNVSGASSVLAQLSSAAAADQIAIGSGLVPVTRQTVAQGSNTTYGRIAYQSAAIAYGWLNPDPLETDKVFTSMLLDINENRSSIDGAVSDAVERLEFIY